MAKPVETVHRILEWIRLSNLRNILQPLVPADIIKLYSQQVSAFKLLAYVVVQHFARNVRLDAPRAQVVGSNLMPRFGIS